MVDIVHDVWVEVDLSALKHNLRQVQSLITDKTSIMAVVKANGFGHGYVEPAKAFLEAGAASLGVTRLDEALILRNAGIDAPVLLFAPIQPQNVETAVEADLQITVTEPALAKAVSEAAIKLNRTALVHVKVDTGMGRLGVFPDDVPKLFDALRALPNLEIAGIYTHFAAATEPDLTPARKQLDTFAGIIRRLQEAGITYGAAHAANSAAFLRMPESHLDMIRPGTVLYGQYPSQAVPRSLDLRNTWHLKARICDIRQLPAGTAVGYGAEYKTARPTRAAVVPIGFADGFTLAPEGPIYRQSPLHFAARKWRRKLAVQIGGNSAPVIGRVAMQIIMVDVTDIPGARTGDEVVVPAMRIPASAMLPRVYRE